MKKKFIKIVTLLLIVFSLAGCPFNREEVISNFGIIYNLGIIDGESINLQEVNTTIKIDKASYVSTPYGELRANVGKISANYVIYNNYEWQNIKFGLPISVAYHPQNLANFKNIEIAINSKGTTIPVTVKLADMTTCNDYFDFEEIYNQTLTSYLPDNVYKYEFDMNSVNNKTNFNFTFGDLPDFYCFDTSGNVQIEQIVLGSTKNYNFSFNKKGVYTIYCTHELDNRDLIVSRTLMTKEEFINENIDKIDLEEECFEKYLECFKDANVFDLYSIISGSSKTIYQNYLLEFQVALSGNNSICELSFEYEMPIDEDMIINYCSEPLSTFKKINQHTITTKIENGDNYDIKKDAFYRSTKIDDNHFECELDDKTEFYSMVFEIVEDDNESGCNCASTISSMFIGGLVFVVIYLIIYGVRRGNKK